MRCRNRRANTGDVDMSPLIDMVFILLIFFYGEYYFCKRYEVRS